MHALQGLMPASVLAWRSPPSRKYLRSLGRSRGFGPVWVSIRVAVVAIGFSEIEVIDDDLAALLTG